MVKHRKTNVINADAPGAEHARYHDRCRRQRRRRSSHCKPGSRRATQDQAQVRTESKIIRAGTLALN
jgi:hypothetical protein